MPNPNVLGKLKAGFKNLPAGKQKLVVLVAVLAVGLLLAYLLANTGAGSGPSTQGPQEKITNQLLPKDAARALGVAGVVSDVTDTKTEQRKLRDEVAKLTTLVQRLQSERSGGARTNTDTAMRQQILDLRAQMDRLKQEKSAQAGQRAAVPPSPVALPAPDASLPAAPGAPSFGTNRTVDLNANYVETQAVGAAPAGTPPAQVPATAGAEPVPAIKDLYIPSGSIVDGVLITGLDAPTGKLAMKDPIPVLVRVKHEAILPNRYRADVKECFILAAGHGDLASERAYLRATTLSCIRKDKKVIDLKVQMYAVGPDGKAGIRGRLVSKQGQLIARAALAGVGQGISQAFSGNNLRLNFAQESPDYSGALQQGMGGGVGSAFDRIAKYYLDMADQMFPVIEIDAGTRMNLVMVKGETMATVR